MRSLILYHLQIESKKKAEKKLPTWYNHKNIYYPNKINIEQTSSELTAEYKSSLISGKNIIDITGGFGVDCYAFSKRVETVIHCEINRELSKIVYYNFQQLGVKNIETICNDGMGVLKNSDVSYDWIYIDPSRRHDSKGKVFFLEDCLPNVPENLELLFARSNKVMIKTSPLLDLTAGSIELKHVKTIHIVAVDNDVKELLWILEKDYKSGISIETVNLRSSHNEYFKFSMSEEAQAEAMYAFPQNYLYEPNSAILKSGAFNLVGIQFKVSKLHEHSHLYTNSTLIPFPGRQFKIESVHPFNKKTIKNLHITKANITTRNFPDSVQKLRTMFRIKDGGAIYLYFTKNLENEKIVIVCSKLD